MQWIAHYPDVGSDVSLDALRLHNLVADGIADQVCRAAQTQLAHDVFAMSLDRGNADPELVSRFLVAPAFGEQLDNLAFA